MIVSSRPLVEFVPVQPAAMAGRQLCQWDKDSCADAGFLKIDLLGLGMLSAVEDCVEQIARPPRRADGPFADPASTTEAVYDGDPGRRHRRHLPDRESRADAEAAANAVPRNSTTSRSRSRSSGRGRSGRRACTRTSKPRQRLRDDRRRWPVEPSAPRGSQLRDTLGVVVFQDQVLEVAIALAGFSVGEAEGLRRAMSRKRSEEALEAFRQRFVEGAAGKGRQRRDSEHASTTSSSASPDSAFPKSHAAAFGLLAYQSAWLRHHYPAEFLCALLNAQPMGFYPAGEPRQRRPAA